jgi:hypothetical protein
VKKALKMFFHEKQKLLNLHNPFCIIILND